MAADGPGLAEHLGEAGGELRLAGKQVLLVNRDQPLPTLAFLIL